jgi:dephospho-CoA kinase
MRKPSAPVIILTGGTGAGKSTVAQIFKKLQARVVDVDRLARKLLEPGEPVWLEVLEAFCGARFTGKTAPRKIYLPADFTDNRGREFPELPWVIGPQGKIRRDKLGAAVFSDPAALNKLNRIAHPRLRKLLEAKVAALQARSLRPVVLDMAVYPEKAFRGLGDVVLWVRAPGGLRAQRLAENKHLSFADATVRVRAQWPDEAFRQVADFILPNLGSDRDLRQGAEKIWPRLLAKAAGGRQ